MSKLYLDGYSIGDISGLLAISRSGIYRTLKKYGIKFKKVGSSDYPHKFRKYSINEDFFEKINSPNKAYILGFLYADGNQHSKLNQIRLKLQSKDKYILEKIKVCMGIDNILYCHKAKHKAHQDQYNLVISSKKMCSDLSRHGMVPKKTFIVKFPTFLQPDLTRHFIRGYFDGDGCFYIDNKRLSFEWNIIGTTQLCQELQKIFLNKFNIKSTIQHDNRCAIGINRLRVRRRKDILNISEWLYSDAELFLERKYSKFLEFKEIVYGSDVC